MSLQFRVSDQVLTNDDSSDTTVARLHQYDAFLNLVSADRYAFQRDAVREVLRFLVSDKYPDLESLARANWEAREMIRLRHESLAAYLDKMPLRGCKAVSLDLATGTGKSFVMYALAAIALAEGLADQVLVLCPSLTIEEGLFGKFTDLAGNSELCHIMKELGANVPIPAIKHGDETIRRGDICVENVHAVYEATGSSIRDSLKNLGHRTLVLNDEAHHLFGVPGKEQKQWMKFLQDGDFGFTQIVNVTGTPYVDNDYFPDVIYRYGLKQAIADRVVKTPNYKLEDTYTAHDWQKTHAVHLKNQEQYGSEVKPLSIVVTQEIAKCVEVHRELCDFLMKQEHLTATAAAAKVIWVASGVPSSGPARARVDKAFRQRGDKDTAEKQRIDNLALLKQVDETVNPVEWIVSVSMLTEGWDVSNVFQVVPHESRAFSSKLLIAQVLGRGLRVPPGLTTPPLVTINNHEAWSKDIGSLLTEVLEVENTLGWGYDDRRSQYVFPLYNLRYEPVQTTVETKQELAKEPDLAFMPQDKSTTEYSTFSNSGILSVEMQHSDWCSIEDAVKLVRLFLREKDEVIAAAWPKTRLREKIVSALENAGQDTTFLSKANLLRLQQSFGPMFRPVNQAHPRMGLAAKALEAVSLPTIPRQSFSEGMLRENGTLYTALGDTEPFSGHDAHLWEQYQRYLKMYAEYGDEASPDAKAIASRIRLKEGAVFKTPWNVHYASYEPERAFSDLLFDQAILFESFVKMPNVGGYSFPYSYKPGKAAKTHVANERFNPDFFIRVKASSDILVVEIKADGDESSRNRAKCRDGMKHFTLLNQYLKDADESWRYHFYFLTPDDYAHFFTQVQKQTYVGWQSGLMVELMA